MQKNHLHVAEKCLFQLSEDISFTTCVAMHC